MILWVTGKEIYIFVKSETILFFFFLKLFYFEMLFGEAVHERFKTP